MSVSVSGLSQRSLSCLSFLRRTMESKILVLLIWLQVAKFEFTIYTVPDGLYGVFDHETNKWNGLVKELLARKQSATPSRQAPPPPGGYGGGGNPLPYPSQAYNNMPLPGYR